MFGDPTVKAATRRRPCTGPCLTGPGAAVLVGIALLAASCASAPPQRGALHHASKSAVARGPVTKPQVLSTTSSTAATTTTSTSVKAVPTTAPTFVPPRAPTTTTSDPLPPVCNWANFSTTVTSDQAAYPQGQTVHITLTYRNAGPRCTLYVTGYGCPEVDIDDAAGQQTWTTAPIPSTGCAETFTPGSPTVLETTWAQSYPVDWSQGDCSTRSGGNAGTCAGPQVAAGQYQVIGRDVGGASRMPSSAPLVVTIS